MFTSQILALGLLVAAPLASGHGMITAAAGDLGGKGIGLGVSAATSDNENDVTVFKTGVFGAAGGKAIVLATDLTAQEQITGDTLPQVSTSAGIVTMTYHQINADGAGPVSCSVSADGTGKTFVAMKVTTNVPGTNGKSTVTNTDFPLVADLPAGTTCTGTVGTSKNVCAVKCANPVGPFGSMVLVQQGGAAGAAVAVADANTTAAANTTAVAATGASAKKTGKKGKKGKKVNKERSFGGSLAARAKGSLIL